MTKKDYEATAAIIAGMNGPNRDREHVAEAIWTCTTVVQSRRSVSPIPIILALVGAFVATATGYRASVTAT